MKSKIIISLVLIAALSTVASIIFWAPFSVAVAIDSDIALKPNKPISVNLRGMGLRAEVVVEHEGKRIKGKFRNGKFYPADELEYDSTYTVRAKVINWFGRSQNIKENIRTWTTPKIEKIEALNSLGNIIEGTSTLPQTLTPDSTITITFNRKIGEVEMAFDNTSTMDFRLKTRKIVIPLIGLPQGSSHSLEISRLRDFENHPFIKNLNLKFSIVSEPTPSFSLSDGQIVALNQSISLSFNKPMIKESVLVNVPFTKTYSWNEEGTVLTIKPAGQSYSTDYLINLAAGAKGIDGSFLATEKVVSYKTTAKAIDKNFLSRFQVTFTEADKIAAARGMENIIREMREEMRREGEERERRRIEELENLSYYRN